jgi:phosphomannomutase
MYLSLLREIVDLGVIGNADRFGIVDEDGTFFRPNYIIALLLNYLLESRKLEE